MVSLEVMGPTWHVDEYACRISILQSIECDDRVIEIHRKTEGDSTKPKEKSSL